MTDEDDHKSLERVNAALDPAPANDETVRALVTSAKAATDFTLAYDEAVDTLEDAYLEQAFTSLGVIDVDAALVSLEAAGQVREGYLTLLELCEADSDHPLADKLAELRDYAIAMNALREHLSGVARAMVEYRKGRGEQALRLLDGIGSSAHLADERVASMLGRQLAIVGETLAGLIRHGALDHAGARAAFDRAAAIARAAREDLDTVVDGVASEGWDLMLAGLDFQMHTSDAQSLGMQYLQLMDSGDLVGASEAARAASASLLNAAAAGEVQLPALAPLLQAASFEALAQAREADAMLELERGDWEAATTVTRDVRALYESASRVCLDSVLPGTTVQQERFLNSGFIWTVRFRRQIERERAHSAQVTELRLEIQQLYSSLRGALAPAGVVVNNATEMVNSVHQQVELTTRFETNVRALLRDLPAAVAESSISERDKAALSNEAAELARSTETGGTFFDRVRAFAARLASTTQSVAETAGPVMALLKALSIV